MKLNNLVHGVVNNWPAKVLSLAAALMIYLLVQHATLDQRMLTTDIAVQVPEGLRVQQPADLEAEVTIRGPGDAIFRIPANQILLEADVTYAEGPGSHSASVRLRDVYLFHLIDPLEITYIPRRVTVELIRDERSEP